MGAQQQTYDRRVAVGLGCVGAGVGLALLAARREPRPARDNIRAMRPRHDRAVRVSKTFTINRPPDEVYRFWRQLDNLPSFMRHLESVVVTGGRISHWTARGPAGMRVEWDAEMIEDTPERISWRSLDGADVRNSGTVEFKAAPGGRGTELRVRLQYEPPGGRAGAWIAKLFGEEPERQLDDDLRRVKMLLEAGEIARAEGSSSVFQPAQPRKRARAAGGGRR